MSAPVTMSLSEMVEAHHIILGAALQRTEMQTDPEQDSLLEEARQITQNQAAALEAKAARIEDLERKLGQLEKKPASPAKDAFLARTTNHLVSKSEELKGTKEKLAEAELLIAELRAHPPTVVSSMVDQLERKLAASEQDLTSSETALGITKEKLEQERKKSASRQSMLYRERRKVAELQEKITEMGETMVPSHLAMGLEAQLATARKEVVDLTEQLAAFSLSGDPDVKVHELEREIDTLAASLKAANIELSSKKTPKAGLESEMARAAEVLRKALDSDDPDKLDTYLGRALGILDTAGGRGQ